MKDNSNSSDNGVGKRLHDCESRLSGIMQHSPSIIFLKDLEGHYLLINRQFEILFNISNEEIQGKTGYDLFPAKAADLFHKNSQKVIETAKVSILNEMVLHGSTEHTYFTVIYPTRDSNGIVDGICGIATDITDRKQAEESLQTIFDSAADGIMLANIESQRFVNANNAVCQMLGYSAEEFKQLSIADIHPAESMDYVQDQIKKQLNGEILLAPNIPITRKDGTVFFADISASVTNVYGYPHLLGIVRDITERKRAEAERKLLMSANEQTCEIIIITDHEGTMQYVNPSFTKITGYTEKEAIGKNPRILKSGIQDAVYYKKMWKTLSQGNTWQGHFINKKKDGTIYTEDATISPMLDDCGKITNYVAVKRDISNELEIEQQLQQAQKMEAVGQLAGGIAHDFNNLLHIIRGYSDLLLMDSSPDNPDYQKIEGIQNAAMKAAALTRQLLTFSRRQVIQPEDRDLNLLINEILTMLRRLIGENIELNFVAEKSLDTICADKSQMEQLLINLCVNARDAMPNGGKLTVETHNISITDEYAKMHVWSKPGNYTILGVSDNGCGMNKELKSHIFDPFFTTKKIGKGTGLGLATVFGIVKQHNGFINVYSEVDKGTTFRIYLPTVERQPAGRTKKDVTTADGGNETILVAEDDEGVLKLATMILSDAGYTVLSACNGCEMVKVYEENASDIDLILTDVIMPNMSGKDAMDHILKKHPDIPHIYASGYSENAIQSQFIQHDKANLLQKPYGLKTLLKAVRTALNTTV